MVMRIYVIPKTLGVALDDEKGSAVCLLFFLVQRVDPSCLAPLDLLTGLPDYGSCD